MERVCPFCGFAFQINENQLVEGQDKAFYPNCVGKMDLKIDTPQVHNNKEENTISKKDPIETILNKLATYFKLI